MKRPFIALSWTTTGSGDLCVAGRLCGRREVRGKIQGRWRCWASAHRKDMWPPRALFVTVKPFDARKCDIDVHPAYATQILGNEKHPGTDLRVRLAFCYADDNGDDEPTSPVHFFALPRRAEAAVDRGLALLAAWHCIRPNDAMTSSLCGKKRFQGDEQCRPLALQLSANDETKAFSTLSGFPTLSAAAGMRSKHGDLFAYVRSSEGRKSRILYDATARPEYYWARPRPGPAACRA